MYEDVFDLRKTFFLEFFASFDQLSDYRAAKARSFCRLSELCTVSLNLSISQSPRPPSAASLSSSGSRLSPGALMGAFREYRNQSLDFTPALSQVSLELLMGALFPRT
jgi:hypothetical protein